VPKIYRVEVGIRGGNFGGERWERDRVGMGNGGNGLK